MQDTSGNVAAELKQPAEQAAVDGERDAVHIPRALGRQEADDVAELLRRSPAADGNRRHVGLGWPLRIELVEACGGDAAWRDAVDGDPARAQLARERLRP